MTISGNCRTGLARRRRQADPMAEFDRLPPAARKWLSQAILPWSPRSVRRLWVQALRMSGGDERVAVDRLSHAEMTRLARERRAVSSPSQQGQNT